jgi:hypothetical protein
MKFQEIMLKYCVKLCIEQSFYQCIFQIPYREASRRKYLKDEVFFLWLPLNEISGNYAEILSKTMYRIVILSTHLFRILTGKPVEENTKR